MTAAHKPLLAPGPAKGAPVLQGGLSPALPMMNKETGTRGDRKKLPHYISGEHLTPRGTIFRITGKLTWRDRLGTFRARISGYRMKYQVSPGLYALGNPGESSPVAVTANYKMSFDELRRSLADTDAWILVLDTGGINVWCAAGKGTFGTSELIKRIDCAGLHHIVKGRSVIVPQLGAPGINAAEVKSVSGFRVRYGPVLARDLSEYISSGYKKEKSMSEVPFSLIDRLVLIPMELNPAVKKFIPLALGLFVISGLTPEGIIFREAFRQGGALITILASALVAGAVLVPVLLPFIPIRAFALKGAAAGFFIIGALFASKIFKNMDPLIFTMTAIMAPVISSYLALMFTGTTTFTNISGVKKEMRYAIPLYIFLSTVSAILLIIFKIKTWGMS